MATTTPTSKRPATGSVRPPRASWWDRWTRRPPPVDDNPDAVVGMWKAAWTEGAQARWSTGTLAVNPYSAEPARSAWNAGHHWAGLNPDRRSQQPSRMAHRRRRSTDTSPYITGAVGLGVVSLTVFAVSRGLRRWRQGSKANEND